MPIKVLIFDLDDTLYPEKEFVMSGFKAVSEFLKKTEGLEIFEKLAKRFNSGERGDLFTPVLAEHIPEVRESYVKELVKVYRSHKPSIKPFPEVRRVLANLKGQYRLGLISDGHLSVQKKKLASLNLREFFELIIFTDLWGHSFWKPHPRSFREAISFFRVDPSEAVYIGDNPLKDFIGARQVGMSTLRIRRKGTFHHDLKRLVEEEADDEYESLNDLLNYVKTA